MILNARAKTVTAHLDSRAEPRFVSQSLTITPFSYRPLIKIVVRCDEWLVDTLNGKFATEDTKPDGVREKKGTGTTNGK